MSSILDFGDFTCIVTDCPLFLGDSIWSGIFVILDYYPAILTVLMYAFSLYYYELYTFLVSLILTFDLLLNWVLRYSIAIPARYPGCGDKYEMPSFSSQHACVFLTIIFMFFSLWNKIIDPHRIALLNIATIAVLTARVFIGINTSFELIAGAIVGVIEGIIFQLIIYFLIYPHFTKILKWRFVRVIGLEDNICTTELIKQKERERKSHIVREVAKLIHSNYINDYNTTIDQETFVNNVETLIIENHSDPHALHKRKHAPYKIV